jgi:hypothetical protein
MKIELPEGYVIRDDGVGYAFYKMTTRKNKEGVVEPTESVICYPATLDHALKRYAREVNLDYEGDLSGYINRIEETIQKATKNLRL